MMGVNVLLSGGISQASRMCMWHTADCSIIAYPVRAAMNWNVGPFPTVYKPFMHWSYPHKLHRHFWTVSLHAIVFSTSLLHTHISAICAWVLYITQQFHHPEGLDLLALAVMPCHWNSLASSVQFSVPCGKWFLASLPIHHHLWLVSLVRSWNSDRLMVHSQVVHISPVVAETARFFPSGCMIISICTVDDAMDTSTCTNIPAGRQFT